MEVADRLAIINHGHLEQVGTPADMYDHPANEFVLTFLGSATRLDGQWVRPHDLVVHPLADGKPSAERGRGHRGPRHPSRVRGQGRRGPRRRRVLLGPAQPGQRGRARPAGGPAGLGGAVRRRRHPGPPPPHPQRLRPSAAPAQCARRCASVVCPLSRPPLSASLSDDARPPRKLRPGVRRPKSEESAEIAVTVSPRSVVVDLHGCNFTRVSNDRFRPAKVPDSEKVLWTSCGSSSGPRRPIPFVKLRLFRNRRTQLPGDRVLTGCKPVASWAKLVRGREGHRLHGLPPFPPQPGTNARRRWRNEEAIGTESYCCNP